MFSKKHDGPVCGFDKKPCLKEGCRQWVVLHGQHAQTGEPISEGSCAITAIAHFQADTNRMTMGMQSDMESMRNEVVDSNRKVQMALSLTVEAMKSLLNGVGEAWQKYLTDKPRELPHGD